MLANTSPQAKQCEEFDMRRGNFDPTRFGISMTRDDFQDMIAGAFGAAFKGQFSFDELLLHPRSALRFCDDVRVNNRWHDLPDDIILRSIMSRRKRPDR